MLTLLRQISARRSEVGVTSSPQSGGSVIPPYMLYDLSLENLCLVQMSRFLQTITVQNYQSVCAQFALVPQDLRLKLLQFMDRRRELTDLSLPALLQGIPFSTLVIPHNPSLTDAWAPRVAPLCAQLSVLDVRACAMSFASVGEILKVCGENLLYLDVSGKARNGNISELVDALKYTPNLTYLGVRDTNKDCSALSVLPQLCPRLQKLELITSHGYSPDFFQKLTEGLPDLAWLDVSWCAGVDDACVGIVAKNLGPKLVGLNVEMCCRQGSIVTEVGIMEIAQHCPNLEHLSVGNLKWITDSGIIAVTQSCTRLKSLHISGCEVTDVGVEAIARNSPNLEVLSAVGLAGITDNSILQIYEKCEQLQLVDLANCVRVSNDAKKKFGTKLFKLDPDTRAAYIPFSVLPKGIIY